ncbi:hypothetical protein KM043_005748 [Ampulex compressa]|nr:hypothetical protein KM043_005748 [Ampulex compressa]
MEGPGGESGRALFPGPEPSRWASYLPRSSFMIFTLIRNDRDGARELHSYSVRPPRPGRAASPFHLGVLERISPRSGGPEERHNGLPMISVAVFFVSGKQEPAMVSLDRWLNLAE